MHIPAAAPVGRALFINSVVLDEALQLYSKEAREKNVLLDSFSTQKQLKLKRTTCKHIINPTSTLMFWFALLMYIFINLLKI